MRPTGPARAPVVRSTLRVVRRRWRVITFCALVVLGADLAYSLLQDPVYEATADVLIRGADPEPLSPAARAELSRAARTEVVLIESVPVQAAVERELGFEPSVSASQVGDTDVIRIEVESQDPAQAVRAADAYARTYVDLRVQQLEDELTQANRDLQAQITGVDRRLAVLPPGPERDRLTEELNRFRAQADQLTRQATLSRSYVRVLNPATSSGAPVRPRTVRDAVVAGLIGLAIGLILAAVLESLDDTVKSPDQLEQALGNVPVIAVIPPVPAKPPDQRGQLVTLDDPDSPAAEGYRKLRTALQFLARDRPMQTLQITSPSAMQGKTTTAANLGVVVAQTGLRVVVVGCDLRRPQLHELFGLEDTTGFTSVLSGSVPLSAAVRPVPERPGLYVLPSGPLPSDPAELLASRRTVEVLTSLQAGYDVVLLDTAPVVPVSDAVVLSRRVDATLLVCLAEVTSSKDATRAAEALRQVDAPLIGAVLHGTIGETFEPDLETYARETPRISRT